MIEYTNGTDFMKYSKQNRCTIQLYNCLFLSIYVYMHLFLTSRASVTASTYNYFIQIFDMYSK